MSGGGREEWLYCLVSCSCRSKTKKKKKQLKKRRRRSEAPPSLPTADAGAGGCPSDDVVGDAKVDDVIESERGECSILSIKHPLVQPC